MLSTARCQAVPCERVAAEALAHFQSVLAMRKVWKL